MSDSPDSTNEAPATVVRRGIRWDALAAIIASLVGLLALVVAGYTAHIQRQQVRAQVWPYLLAGNDDGNQSIDVSNKGVGPAIVKFAQIFIDGKPQPDWAHVLTSLGQQPHGFVQSTLNPYVFTPGEELRIFRIPDKDRWQAFRDAATARMTMDICYCSTLEECWMYSDRHPVGYKAIAQLVHPIDRCPKLPDAEIFNN